ncbi:hypothetical protein [uncultured Thiodictyon sp.]|jgi:hypothetical protein|uniref:hypothetical protein n=1 Tax=uncultured Thiodictyon sp. TaxID=1846217 RepID=UPI0025DF97FE|nr:hypothetical protein [uncultured Thiodictyon sp.]
MHFGALIIVLASDVHLESKASALGGRSKAEALDSSGLAPRLAETMTEAHFGVRENLGRYDNLDNDNDNDNDNGAIGSS